MEHDEAGSDVADPEEPSAWQRAAEPHPGTEAADADFADQRVPVDDSPFDEDESL